MSGFTTFTSQNAPAGLDFSVEQPGDWVFVPLPAESHDFSDVLHFAPVAVLMAPYAPVVFAVAARPGYAEGAVSQWLEYVTRQRGLDPGPMEAQRIGERQGVGCWGAQVENGVVMRARLVFFEDGDRLVNISCMAPDALWATFAPTFLRMLRTFALTTPRGATVAVAPAGTTLAPDSMAPEAPDATAAAAPPARGPLPLPGEEPEGAAGEPVDELQASQVALAQDMGTFDAEHELNVRLRDRGAGLVPNVLDYHEQEHWATLAPAALRATLRVPFGWHVLDDGKRTLVFDAAGHTQVSMQLFRRDGRSDDALLTAKVPELQQQWPALQHRRTERSGMPCLLVRDAMVDGKPIEQAYLLRDAGDGLVLQTRVTSSPEHFQRANELAELLHRDLQFAGAGAGGG